MTRYMPFLRGKQYELMALRELSERIAESGKVLPIIEPVKANPTTRISLDKYVEVSMPFIFVCNPSRGEFSRRPERLYSQIIAQSLIEYDNWVPALQVRRESSQTEVASFLQRYDGRLMAIIYHGLPTDSRARALLRDGRIVKHIFVKGSVAAQYVNGIDVAQTAVVSDPFNRRDRNADYPPSEFFSDMNTVAGNPSRVDFGDFSIVGDHYADTGGPAYAVALHHVHFDTTSGPLYVSHFISDRTDSSVDTPGKTIEALNKLAEALDRLLPNDTEACREYRQMASVQRFRGLGYMKRLAIQHHLEVMLNGGIQL